MSIPKTIIDENKGLGEWSVLVTYRGSITHGMYVPKNDPNCIDDKDVMAVCVPPKDYYYGLKEFHSRGTQEIKQGEWDIVIYELRKFMSLMAKGNPNVLMSLWLDPTHYINIGESGKLLLDNKKLFVGKHVYHSFVGYAHGQLHRMTHLAFKGYMGEKRKSLVEKFGYDTKNAAHLIRLLRMGIEFLNEGKFYVLRPDNNQLLEIKRGEWELDRVKEEAEKLFKRAEEAYDRSSLPVGADIEAINKLCVNMAETALK